MGYTNKDREMKHYKQFKTQNSTNKLFHLEIRESTAPLNIPTPTPATDRGGPVACLSGSVAGAPKDHTNSSIEIQIWGSRGFL